MNERYPDHISQAIHSRRTANALDRLARDMQKPLGDLTHAWTHQEDLDEADCAVHVLWPKQRTGKILPPNPVSDPERWNWLKEMNENTLAAYNKGKLKEGEQLHPDRPQPRPNSGLQY